ncbi:MAG TPA: DUF4957 domain-containing protein [Candidatus Alistipes intestinigallinarum]|uniref:DUF4957 domain-containing protein n=1 Tax=Candidatus Alistipes intestinigallinarum TaxID=2838440 RepID=A0A9D1Z1C5_9BACT|nr:DUF4957 domain-containing protein [Candidatus Alistipes intestinigallinarum]
MKTNYKRLFGGLLMLGALTFAGCHQPDAEIDTLDYSRALQPLNFAAAVDRATGCDVNFSWTVAEKTDYLLSIQEIDEAGQAVGSPIEELIPAAEVSSPYKVALTPERIYTATLQAFSATNPNLPGSLLVEAGPVETYYVMETLSPELVTRAMNSITVKWANDAGEATQLSKIEAVPLDTRSSAKSSTLEVTSEILAAQQAEVTGLTPSTQYVVTLYYSKSTRGAVTAWTAPDTEGATRVESSAELMQAIKDGAEKILVGASAEPYVIDFGEPTEENKTPNPLTAWTKNFTIYGEIGADGSMPEVKALALTLKPGTEAIETIRIENLVLDGDGEGVLVTFDTGADLNVGSYVVRNCEVTNYEKGLIYRGSGDKVLNVSEVLFDGLYIHDLNATGSGGGDLFDLRAGTYGTFTLKNSTMIDAGRTFVFFDANAAFTSITIQNNTLNRVGLATTRKGLVCLRQPVATFVLSKNLFLNEYSTSADMRLISSYDNAQVPSMSGNYFYNINYNSTGDSSYAGPEFFTTKIGSNATAVNQALCLSGNGKILSSDPCVKSDRNRMQLTNSEVIANQVGDPRWWTEPVPETVIASELTPVTEDYAWPLSDDLIFEPQSITETIIYGNLQFIASNETFPVTITSDHTISFSGATSFTADGEPTNNALAIRVSAAGSLVLTPSNAGVGTQLEIIAGTERYTVPCDGVEHTVGLGEIAGDTHVYITATGAVEFSSLSWTTEVSVDGDLKALATPVVTVDPASVAWSAEQDVVFTWEAVANAADYVVTWGDREPVTVEEPTLTIPAATVRELVIGSYPVTVVAQPVETSTKYKASAAGEAKFEVTKITLGTPEVTVAPSTLDAGTAQEVVVSWSAVADAETYAVTFNGQTTNQSETSLTLAADVVSALAAGRYEITVVAQKPSDADHYADSAAGAGELEIKAVGAATTLSWNFSDAGFDAVAAAIGTSDNTDYSGEWNGLNILSGGSKIKTGSNSSGRYIQLGGTGSTEKCVLSFTAPASGTLVVRTSDTGGRTELRDVKVQVGENIQAKPATSGNGDSASTDVITNEFDVTIPDGGATVYVYGVSGIRVYSLSFSYMEAPTATEKTMMLTKDNLADLGLPEGKDDVKALTAPSTWSYEGKAFESVMALSSTNNSASVKVPVLYLYKSTENTALGANYVRSTESLGEKIQKITVTFVDSGKKKGNKLSMYEYVGGEKKLVLSDNESDSDAEVLTYVFSDANDGKFSLENVPRSGSEGDLKIVSIQIDYLGE